MNKLICFLIIASVSFSAASLEQEYTVSEYKDKANAKIFAKKLAECRNNAKYEATVNCKNAERAHHDMQMQNMSGEAVPLPPMPAIPTFKK